MKLTTPFVFSAALFALVVPAFGQGDPATLERIIDEGKNHNGVMPLLDELTHKIGSRLSGSPRLAKAEKWAMAKFRSYGLTNVHLEKWGDIPASWQREPDTYGKMTAPFQVEMAFTTPDWTEGTNGPLRAIAIRQPKTMAEYEKVKDSLKGAWIVTPGFPRRGADTKPEPADEGPYVRYLVDHAGIAGRVFGSRSELVITSGSWSNKTAQKHPHDRLITVSKPDWDRINRNIDFGRKVELEFNLHYTWGKRPISEYNVVADIKGTEKPDEMIIVGGHLDSWDGPGSQGALDNGTGVCTALDAARILMKAHAKPKRTIRFVLWTAEEQGLYGSRGYVKTHMNEMDKISAVLVDDGGTDYQGGYIGPENMRAMMEQAFAPTVKAFPEFPEVYQVVRSIRNQESGSDHSPFWRYRVPGFFTIETGIADYDRIHHTQFDRYEEAIPKYLVQSSTNHAVVSFNLACADQLLPRDPRPGQ